MFVGLYFFVMVTELGSNMSETAMITFMVLLTCRMPEGCGGGGGMIICLGKEYEEEDGGGGEANYFTCMLFWSPFKTWVYPIQGVLLYSHG